MKNTFFLSFLLPTVFHCSNNKALLDCTIEDNILTIVDSTNTLGIPTEISSEYSAFLNHVPGIRQSNILNKHIGIGISLSPY